MREYPIHIWPLNCLILLEMLKDVYSCFYGLVSKSWWEVCCPWSIGREICCNHVRLSLYILAFFLFSWTMWKCVVCFLGVLGRHVSIAQSLLLNPSISLALRQLEAKKRRGTVRRGCFDGKWSSTLWLWNNTYQWNIRWDKKNK